MPKIADYHLTGRSQADKSTLESSSGASLAPATREPCAICLETPITYGLLVACDHVFCLECIRHWRSSSNPDDSDAPALDIGLDGLVPSRNTKNCPLCRKQSHFIIPSSTFPTPPSTKASLNEEIDINSKSISAGKKSKTNNPAKDKIVQRYLAKMKKIPCRYFELEVLRWSKELSRSSLPVCRVKFQPRCYFANMCHYAHISPITYMPYTFSKREIKRMNLQRLARARKNDQVLFPLGPFDVLFSNFAHGGFPTLSPDAVDPFREILFASLHRDPDDDENRFPAIDAMWEDEE
ncbi:hypothetical protein LOZ49_000127 [Ophidiomyces ophidiicola]|nr:hypothetical protein LOZ60_001392 [Ophidiomyces ophidiicola]KAI2016432.1 hypothetical protein LOZ49_000127 [Ophidiomyces ophidiicola]KAI2084056.1 hypothetical protein LOZ36_005159 [Ophidiomyces ophidiicola]KAI2147280.1 hypothetical protein LOZ28_000318 [Ophidiomyces ophidiicola]KAI2256368.1 hypothetical protein LOZ10_005444 [Ophidiomyces ophidiicola]